MVYKERVKELVRKLYYDYSITMQSGQQSKVDLFASEHEYPGVIDKTLFLECRKRYENLVHSISLVPNLDTLAPDPQWAPPITPNSKSWIWNQGIPTGDTYILTADDAFEYLQDAKWVAEARKIQIHTTILNDQAYFYYACLD